MAVSRKTVRSGSPSQRRKAKAMSGPSTAPAVSAAGEARWPRRGGGAPRRGGGRCGRGGGAPELPWGGILVCRGGPRWPPWVGAGRLGFSPGQGGHIGPPLQKARTAGTMHRPFGVPQRRALRADLLGSRGLLPAGLLGGDLLRLALGLFLGLRLVLRLRLALGRLLVLGLLLRLRRPRRFGSLGFLHRLGRRGLGPLDQLEHRHLGAVPQPGPQLDDA